MSLSDAQEFFERTAGKTFQMDIDNTTILNMNNEDDIKIDLGQDSSNGQNLLIKAPNCRKESESSNINVFTCYIGPCPEVVNTNFKHPEFMICYRDGNSRCENSMMRYYCCPLYLTTVVKDGEETFELRAVPTETTENDFAQQEQEQWRKYYNQGASQHQSCHGLGTTQFDCRQLPQFNFLRQYCCSCPPQMMAYYMNYHCHAHPQHSQHNCRSFGYQGYMFPTRGSAMG